MPITRNKWGQMNGVKMNGVRVRFNLGINATLATIITTVYVGIKRYGVPYENRGIRKIEIAESAF